MSAMKSRFKIGSIWKWEAYSPLKIRDMGKMGWVLNPVGIVLPLKCFQSSKIPFKLWNQIISRVPLSLLQTIDSMVVGGGELIWSDTGHNRVVNVGLDEILDKFFKGSTYTASHFVGLTDGTPTTAASDTMGSHSGWAEVTAYDEAARQAYSPGSVSGQAVNNSGSKASFTIDTNSTTIGGGFLTTVSTKGGSTGILISVEAATAGDVTLNDNDTLTAQIDYTASDV